MADFNKYHGPRDPLPMKFVDMGDGTAAPVVSASVSVGGVTVDPFTPNGNVASLTAGVASSNVALPAGTVVVVTNNGSVTAFLKLSVGAGTAAVTDFALVAGASVGLKVGSNTYLNAITASSTAALRISGGAGLPVGFGGGSSGGGGGGDASAANQTAVIGTKAPGTAAASSLLAGAVYTSGGVTLTNGQQAALQVDSAGRLLTSSTADATAANQTAVTGSKAPGTAAASALLTGAVYNSTPPTLTNGQQAALQASAAGRLLVDAAITGGGDASAANQTAVIGSKAAGTAAASSQLGGGVYNSTPPTLTNGQQCAFQFDANGQLKISGAISGAGDASATNQTRVQAVIGAATAPAYMNAVGGVYNSTPITLTNGQSSAHQLDANGYLKVNVASQTGVAQGSTSSGQTGSPILCRTLSAAPTDTTAQSNMPVMDTKGNLLTMPYGHDSLRVKGVSSALTNTTAADVIAAPGASICLNITSISVCNEHATQGTAVEILDDTTVIDVIPARHEWGGGIKTYPSPMKLTANKALKAKCRTSGANVTVSAQGYTSP